MYVTLNELNLDMFKDTSINVLRPATETTKESDISRRWWILIDIDADSMIPRLSPEIEISLFRVVQEAITNVIRHAEASRVAISLRLQGNSLELAVRDNGRGFDTNEVVERAAAGRHLGLLGIRERIRMLGGKVEIESTPEQGTEVRVRIPLGEEA